MPASRHFVPVVMDVRVAVIVQALAGATVGLVAVIVQAPAVATVGLAAAIGQVRKAAVSEETLATAAAARKTPRLIVAAAERDLVAVVAVAMPSPAVVPDAAPWRSRHADTRVSAGAAAACAWVAAVAAARAWAAAVAGVAVVAADAAAVVAGDDLTSHSSTTSLCSVISTTAWDSIASAITAATKPMLA